MRPRHAAAALIAALACAGAPREAADAAPDPRLSEVVARVGPVAVTAGDLERRLRAVPGFQLATFGSTPAEVRRAFLETVVVPQILVASGARARGLEKVSPFRERIVDALRGARLGALRAEIEGAGAVRPEEVARYYEDNRARFDSPPRIQIWRILCKTRDEALSTLAEARKAGTPDRWRELARERSTDRPTAMRGGSLGLVAPDGTSNEAGVRADPAVIAAAARVKDGDFVPEPVAEGGGFAVVWRRGSVPAVRRALEDEAGGIRQVLLRQKLEQGARDLVADLRKRHLRDYTPQIVDRLEVNPSAEVSPRRRPGVLPRKPAGDPAPSATPKGLR